MCNSKAKKINLKIIMVSKLRIDVYVPRLLIKHSNDLEIMRITRGILPLGDHPTSFAQHVIVDKPV